MSRHAPLTPEELELRRQLEAAAGPGPSPQLDARVLAAARQAAAPPAHPATATAPVARGWRRARRRRWIAPLGLAASLVLAFGVAWQLREPPLPGQALPAAAPAAADRSAPAAAQAVHAPAAEEAAPAADAGAADSAATPAVQRPAAAVARKLPPPPPDDAAVAMPRAPLPAAPAPVAAMAEPAPAASPAAEVAAAAEAARAAQDMARARQAQGAARRAAERSRQEASAMRPGPAMAPRQAIAAPPPPPASAPVSAAAIEDGPPPVAMALADPQEWLQWIRGLQADGDIEGARASLQWFVREHPQLEVPEDLRPLLEQAP